MDFYETKVLECGSDQKQLFNVVKSLMGPKVETKTSLSAEFFSENFMSKIDKIRDGFQPSLMFATGVGTSSSMEQFELIAEDSLMKMINAAPSKACSLDPWPTWLIKKHLSALSPVLTDIVNRSLQEGYFPMSMREALVSPLLKKPSLDQETFKNYRPVSNLSFLSKVIERVVAFQLGQYLTENGLHHPFQSAYRPNHSVETALVRVHNDIMQALDKQQGVILVLLDLSAAFDTVDHTILLNRLKNRFGLHGNVLALLISYLDSRKQVVSVAGEKSAPRTLKCGVPQGSVLGPTLFSCYISPLYDITKRHALSTQQYADDDELYSSFHLNEESTCETMTRIELCVHSENGCVVTNLN